MFKREAIPWSLLEFTIKLIVESTRTARQLLQKFPYKIPVPISFVTISIWHVENPAREHLLINIASTFNCVYD